MRSSALSLFYTRSTTAVALPLLLLLLPLSALADHSPPSLLSRAATADIFSSVHSGKLTFFGQGGGDDAPPYCPNCGACGRDPTPKFRNYYVALSVKIYKKSQCRQCVRVTCNDSRCVKGRSVVLEVADACEPCGPNHIDASLDGMAALMKDGKTGAKRAGVINVKWTGAPCTSSITSTLQLSDFSHLSNATAEFQSLLQPPPLPNSFTNAPCDDENTDVVRFDWDQYRCCSFGGGTNCSIAPVLGEPVQMVKTSVAVMRKCAVLSVVLAAVFSGAIALF